MSGIAADQIQSGNSQVPYIHINRKKLCCDPSLSNAQAHGQLSSVKIPEGRF